MARLKEGPKALRPSIGLEPAMGTGDSGALDRAPGHLSPNQNRYEDLMHPCPLFFP